MKNEECTINLTENDSRTMSSSRFTAHKNQQKILGKKNPRSRKTKITHKSPQFTPWTGQQIKSEISSDGVCVFSPQFVYLYCITFLYLHLYLKSVYLS